MMKQLSIDMESMRNAQHNQHQTFNKQFDESKHQITGLTQDLKTLELKLDLMGSEDSVQT